MLADPRVANAEPFGRALATAATGVTSLRLRAAETRDRSAPAEAFRHEALLYAGRREFLDGTVPFIREGLAVGEPTLVVVDADKIAALRAELGDARDRFVCSCGQAARWYSLRTLPRTRVAVRAGRSALPRSG
jgi:hypothetical protein